MKAEISPKARPRRSFLLARLVCFVLSLFALLVAHNGGLHASGAAPQQKPAKSQYVRAMAAAQQATRPVPDLRDKTLEAATKVLGDANLKLGEVAYGVYGTAPGTVARQFPAAGEFVKLGSPVKVWVTRETEPPPPPFRPPLRPPVQEQKGDELVEVPDLRSHVEEEAPSILTPRGLRYGGAKRIPSDRERPGHIFDQAPRPGEWVVRGTPVWVAVAVGKPPEPPVEVPDVVHRYRDEAKQRLELAGLQVNDADITEKSSEEQTGIVLSQYPLAGTKVVRGTPVSLVVSRQMKHRLVLRSDPASAVPGKPITFTAELDPPFPGATFQFNFGEGPGSGELSVPQATHEYSDDGDFVAFAIATIDGRQVISNRVTLPIHSVPLTVTLVPNRDHATTDEAIEFHARIDPPPAPADAQYSFHFGDSSPVESSRSPDVQHTYRQDSTYWAWVTVRTMHEQLSAGRPAHEHQFASQRVQLSIVPPPPPPVWPIVATVLLAAAGVFYGYRWYVMSRVKIRVGKDVGKLQPTPLAGSTVAGAAMQFRAVRSPGEQTVACRGPLVARIETIHE